MIRQAPGASDGDQVNMTGHEDELLVLDLSHCAQEPIHIPGAIQPHGAVIAAQADGLLVTHASANLLEILGKPAEDALGKPLANAIGDAACDALLSVARHDRMGLGRLQSIAHAGAGPLTLQSYRSGERICVDIEPVRIEIWQRTPVLMAQSVIETFSDATSRTELCELAVNGLAMLSGYDRVMAYRFDRDGNGEVIAEVCATGLPPYLGQHYPASDVPAQAREQYLRQRVGAIADADYRPVPLLADLTLDGGQPLDLTHSALRSASPVHRQYMRNMGTAASLTIGLANGPKLWGMLVCHHTTPRIAGPELRAIADMIGQVVSLLLGSLGSAEIYAQRLDRNVTLSALTERLAAPQPLANTLAAMEAELLYLVDARGAIVRLSDVAFCIGRTPEPAAAARAFALLHAKAAGNILPVDDLALRYPELAACTQDGSGALMLPLADDGEDAILWFRPERARTVTWGGNPSDHATADLATGGLSPRVSFEAWKEFVHARSAPWADAELELAVGLRHAIEAEAARRTRAALYMFEGVFESWPTALVLASQGRVIKMLNRKAERMFGYDRAELEGKPLELLVAERFRDQYSDECRQAVANRDTRMIGDAANMSGLRRDGTEFPLEISLGLVNPVDYAGELIVKVSIIDLTERRASEREKQQNRRELERSYADLEEFAYAISHDLKSPLNAIGNLASWISKDVAAFAKPETMEHIGLLQRRVVRLQLLLEGLLEYSSLHRNDNPIVDVNVEEVVREVVAVLAPLPDFAVSFAGEGTSVIRTDRMAILMILENLIGNGLRHHDRTSGSIVVSMQMKNGVAEIRVSDDGPGIPTQFHDRIFNIFETLKSRDEVEGSGIGLAIVKRKVEAHGDAVWVESGPPLRGATFAFTWRQS
jgi:PAS domain S-box-containing protein